MTEDSKEGLVITDRRAGALETQAEQHLPEPVQVRSEAGGLLLQAMARGLPTEQLELFLNHHREHALIEQRALYAAALSKAQGEYGVPVKVAKSDRGKYAPMDQDVAAIREANARYGISYFHRTGSRVIEGAKPPSAVVTVQCIVRHEGHEEAHPPMETIATEIPGQNRGPQMSLTRAIKGETTFLRRLTVEAAFGLAPEDDDDGMAIRSQTQARRNDSGPPAEIISLRAQQALKLFGEIGVMRAELEGPRGAGVPATEWSKALLDNRLIPLYQELKDAPAAERPALVKQMFHQEPPDDGGEAFDDATEMVGDPVDREPGQEG